MSPVDLLFASEQFQIAYIDGGTGSMLIQAALAGVLTMAYFAKGQWAIIRERLSSALGRNRKNSD